MLSASYMSQQRIRISATSSDSRAGREDCRVGAAQTGRQRQVRTRAQDDLIDDGAILALLDADRLSAARLKVDVRAESPPAVVRPSPAARWQPAGAVLQHHLEGAGCADAGVGDAG